MIPYIFAAVLVASALAGNFLPGMIGQSRQTVQEWILIALVPFFIFAYMKALPKKEDAPEEPPAAEPQNEN